MKALTIMVVLSGLVLVTFMRRDETAAQPGIVEDSVGSSMAAPKTQEAPTHHSDIPL